MAVDATESLAAKHFNRFPGPWKKRGCVGTFSFDVEATGASGGGHVAINVAAAKGAWGFSELIVPIGLSLAVNSDPGNARVQQQSGKRLLGPLLYAFDMVVQDASYFSPEHVAPRAALEFPESSATILRAVFDTNTDTKVYEFHAFGLVFDTEQMAKLGDWSELVEVLSG